MKEMTNKKCGKKHENTWEQNMKIPEKNVKILDNTKHENTWGWTTSALRDIGWEATIPPANKNLIIFWKYFSGFCFFFRFWLFNHSFRRKFNCWTCMTWLLIWSLSQKRITPPVKDESKLMKVLTNKMSGKWIEKARTCVINHKNYEYSNCHQTQLTLQCCN